MNMGNKYCYHSHISERRFREIIRYFAMDLEASKIAELTNVSRNSVNKILKALRTRLAECCMSESPFQDAIHTDDRRSHRREIPVFGVVNHEGKIFTRILPDFPRKTLQAAIRGKISLDGMASFDGSRSYDSLVDLGYKKQYRLNNGTHDNHAKKLQMNCVDNFWGSTKMRLLKFRGMNKNTFFLHLKETEFRFNHRNEDLYALILEMLRNEPLKLSKSKESWASESRDGLPVAPVRQKGFGTLQKNR